MISLGKFVGAFFFSAFCTTVYAQLISSDFATSADNWTAPSSPTFAYATTGGNPGGTITGAPFAFVGGSGTTYFPWWFVAPGKFLGNRNAYYDGTLRYDMQASSTGASLQASEVQILNNAGVGLYYYPPIPFQPPAAGTWQTFSINLGASLGYWKTTDSPTGTAATQAEIRAILSDLATLNIRGMFRSANVTVRLDNVTMMPPIIINTQPIPASICAGSTATFTTAASNNPNITYHWQRETSPSVWTDVTNTGGYSNATTATLTINSSGNFGAGNYRGRISGLAADDVFTSSVAFALIPLPLPPTTTPVSSCASGTFNLSASGGTNGQYRWYTVSSGGTAIAGETNSTYTTPNLSTTTTYHVSINNGTCESPRTALTVSIVAPPAAPTTTGASICNGGPALVTASGGSNGQYRWYTVATGGTAIAGESNSTYATPNLLGTVTYYVAINNGTCDGPRTPVTVTVTPTPTPPTATATSLCSPATATITASGGTNGQYRWYTVAAGGTAIPAQVNNTFVTSVLSATTTFYVALNVNGCESARTAVIVTVGGAVCSNHPPEVDTTPSSTLIGGTIELDLKDLISDADNNLDPTTLKVITAPGSGATVSIVGLKLFINYAGTSFVGSETITISVCDVVGACTQQTFDIDVVGDIEIFDAMSPGTDGKNDVFFIENIEKLDNTRNNHVTIYNRWGDMVWEGNNYNNTSVVFKGKSKNDGELPSGTYFYKIEFSGVKRTLTGALTLKR